ncbi:MAG: DUF5915 domain-containing protein, partial [Ignavibacterium sp.]
KFNFSDSLVPYNERPEIDRWIISKLNALVEEYEKQMDAYDVTKAARAVSDFTIDQLSNWYVRRSRRRFWKSEMNKEKLSAYQTLYECLVTVAKLTSPFAPFIAEEIYRNLNTVTKKENYESVHLTDFPSITYREPELEEKMDVAQKVVYLTRAIRAKNNLKVRQPLKRMMVVVEKDKRDALAKMKDVILDEVNIKELVVLDDDSEIVNKTAKANFKSIGPKFGKKVKNVAEMIKNFGKDEIRRIESGENIEIEVEGEKLSISKDDVEILSHQIEGWVVESEEGVTVAIDTELDAKLIEEGLAREFVNRVQNMRKDAGFDVTDKINISFTGNSELVKAINNFSDYISNETLAEKLISEQITDGGFRQDWKIGDYECSIRIEKI